MEERQPDLMCVHIPNGAIRTHKERLRMLEQGMTPGMPDLLVIDSAGRHGYMEVKTDRGAISMAQWDIRTELMQRQVPWALVRSLEDVQGALVDWGWGSVNAGPALNSPELPEWPARIEELPPPITPGPDCPPLGGARGHHHPIWLQLGAPTHTYASGIQGTVGRPQSRSQESGCWL